PSLACLRPIRTAATEQKRLGSDGGSSIAYSRARRLWGDPYFGVGNGACNLPAGQGHIDGSIGFPRLQSPIDWRSGSPFGSSAKSFINSVFSTRRLAILLLGDLELARNWAL
ncbi:MAG: hypothetical protein CSA62_10865, partial [Planctomycetota bacterium]